MLTTLSGYLQILCLLVAIIILQSLTQLHLGRIRRVFKCLALLGVIIGSVIERRFTVVNGVRTGFLGLFQGLV
jgi:hypothetical protein